MQAAMTAFCHWWYFCQW